MKWLEISSVSIHDVKLPKAPQETRYQLVPVNYESQTRSPQTTNLWHKTIVMINFLPKLGDISLALDCFSSEKGKIYFKFSITLVLR